MVQNILINNLNYVGAIWAIRFGYDNFGWPNFVDVGRKIREVGANTIGLVESDTYRPFNGTFFFIHCFHYPFLLQRQFLSN